MATAGILPPTMKALVYQGPNQIALVEKPVPKPSIGEALIKITCTTICGSDLHIIHGKLPCPAGVTMGHEPVGVIAALGDGVTGYNIGDRVAAAAVLPCGLCHFCQHGVSSQCGGEMHGGYRMGKSIDGAQAEYVVIPHAMYNLARIPDEVTDEEAVLCTDSLSTGLKGAESADIQLGDSVVVFGQGPVGLCATMGAKLRGASQIIAVDRNDSRLSMARLMGADVVLNSSGSDDADVVAEIRSLTGAGAGLGLRPTTLEVQPDTTETYKRSTAAGPLGEGVGVDVAIEAVGAPETFESCLGCLRVGGTLSSLGVFNHDLVLHPLLFALGAGDHKIVTSLCPGGKERLRRLMRLIAARRIDPSPLLTHHFKLDDIVKAYDLAASYTDGVVKIAIRT